ncbi:MAG: cell division protein ZapA [Bacteroidota bacterium]
MNEISININIAGRNYPLTIAPADEEAVRTAGKMINDKLNVYSEQFSLKDKQDALAMFALEISMEHQKQKALAKTNDELIATELNSIKQLLAPVQL